jgi:hypothetical protein
VLKLARSGEDGDKVLLLVESGVRFHTVEVGRRDAERGARAAERRAAGMPACAADAHLTSSPHQAMPEKADTPSNFTLKLRKHIRCAWGQQAMVGGGWTLALLQDACCSAGALGRIRPHQAQPPASPTSLPSPRCPAPSPVCSTRRLEAVKQLGVDRIVQLTFGSGAATYHLLLEFYAQVGRGGRQGMRGGEGRAGVRLQRPSRS